MNDPEKNKQYSIINMQRSGPAFSQFGLHQEFINFLNSPGVA
jgi:hypothetical protein